MEALESNENIVLLLVIALIIILGICIIDLIIDKLKPNKKTKQVKKAEKIKKEEKNKDIENSKRKIDEMLESIEQDESKIHK